MNITEKRLLQLHTAGREEKKGVLRGIHYSGGYAVATDGYNLVALNQEYPQAYEGKTLDRRGNEIQGRYPDWKKLFTYSVEAVVSLSQLQSGLTRLKQDEERIDEYTPAWRVLRIEDGGGKELFSAGEPTLAKFIAAMNAVKADCAVISKTNMRAGTLLGKCACTYAVPEVAEIITTITI